MLEHIVAYVTPHCHDPEVNEHHLSLWAIVLPLSGKYPGWLGWVAVVAGVSLISVLTAAFGGTSTLLLLVGK